LKVINTRTYIGKPIILSSEGKEIGYVVDMGPDKKRGGRLLGFKFPDDIAIHSPDESTEEINLTLSDTRGNR